MIGGIYSNPNDLAFAVVLTLPFLLAFLVTSKNVFKKCLWALGMLIMLAALFLTASRAGFLNLRDLGHSHPLSFRHQGQTSRADHGQCCSRAFCCWSGGGGKLYDRFQALGGDSTTDESAYGSYEDRMYLMGRAWTASSNIRSSAWASATFTTYSLIWREVHMTYLQMCVEGGIPALILYLMFISCGFQESSHHATRTKDLDEHTVLFVGALHSSLIGFVVGALFSRRRRISSSPILR